jgi:hypothetical protein
MTFVRVLRGSSIPNLLCDCISPCNLVSKFFSASLTVGYLSLQVVIADTGRSDSNDQGTSTSRLHAQPKAAGKTYQLRGDVHEPFVFPASSNIPTASRTRKITACLISHVDFAMPPRTANKLFVYLAKLLSYKLIIPSSIRFITRFIHQKAQ